MAKYLLSLVLILLLARTAHAQTALGGVAITSDGLLQFKATGPVPARRSGQPGLTCISLARVIEQMKTAAAQKAPLPKALKSLQGLTRLDNVFVFPEEHDLVIAGPSEPIRDDALAPTGMISGRPVLQLDDLIVALRAVASTPDAARGRGNGHQESPIYGCSLDLAVNAQQIARDVGQRFAGFPNSRIAAELKNALGPQQVRILGIPADSRVALAMVAADYRLKRIAMGVEPLANVGNALSAGLSSSRVWFEPAYDSILVSDDGLSYQLAGPRLKVLAGAQQFDSAGATPSSAAFAKRFSDQMAPSADHIPAFADLQNLTDLFLLATLIRYDNLAEKSGVDLAWLLDPTNYKPATTPVPRTAETIVSDSGPTIVEGGVMLVSKTLQDLPRGKDAKGALAALRRRPVGDWYSTQGK